MLDGARAGRDDCGGTGCGGRVGCGVASVLVPYTLTAPATAATGAGRHGSITFQLGAGSVSTPTTWNIAAYTPDQPATPVHLAAYRNNEGFSYVSAVSAGNLDGNGDSLPAGGFPAGSTVHYMGVAFHTPPVASGKPDNLTVIGGAGAGPTVQVPPGRYGALALLACGTYGPQAVTVALHYADGSSASVGGVSVDPWFMPPASASAGNVPVVHFPYLHDPQGVRAQPVSLFFLRVPLPSSSSPLTGVAFATVGGSGSNSRLHVFGLSLLP